MALWYCAQEMKVRCISLILRTFKRNSLNAQPNYWNIFHLFPFTNSDFVKILFNFYIIAYFALCWWENFFFRGGGVFLYERFTGTCYHCKINENQTFFDCIYILISFYSVNIKSNCKQGLFVKFNTRIFRNIEIIEYFS